jgi:signal transduction histidine kinase
MNMIDRIVVNVNVTSRFSVFLCRLNVADVVDRPKELTIVTRPRSEGVRVEVKDNGVGVEKEKLESIFQPFYTTKPTGMGMGLSISRSIIKEHAGQLIAKPNDGPGTTFWFTLT